MDAVFEVSLIFVVFPLLAAVITNTGPGGKVGLAALACLMALIGSIAGVFAGTLAGLLGCIVLGTVACILAATVTRRGRQSVKGAFIRKPSSVRFAEHRPEIWRG
jgi:hypothetical protein